MIENDGRNYRLVVIDVAGWSKDFLEEGLAVNGWPYFSTLAEAMTKARKVADDYHSAGFKGMTLEQMDALVGGKMVRLDYDGDGVYGNHADDYVCFAIVPVHGGNHAD